MNPDNETIIQDWNDMIVDRELIRPGIYTTSTGVTFRVYLAHTYPIMPLAIVYLVAESRGGITVRVASEEERLKYQVEHDY